MNYMGGKHRQGPKIADFVREVLKPGQWYVEPFCGALGVARRVGHDKMLLADGSEALINMWKTLQDPSINLPDVVTEEQCRRLNAARDPGDWMTAYAGFGMSFGSKWFGGYARDSRGSTQDNVTRSRNLKIATGRKRQATTGNAVFVHRAYDSLYVPRGSLIYCDPPYAGRTRAHDCEAFDHDKFWGWCRVQVQAGHTLLITEFTIPDDFVVLHTFGDTVVRHHAARPADGTNEVLVCHESQGHFWKKEHTSVR